MTQLPRRTSHGRRLRLVSSDEPAGHPDPDPDPDRNGVSITFSGQMAVDLFRHFVGVDDVTTSDLASAAAKAINALDESADGPLKTVYASSGLPGLPGYPAITVGLVALPDKPDPPPPRCC